MILTAVSLVLVALIAYVWMTRGFFSSLIHLACTIAAGAIAFAFWEPVAYFILSKAPTRGFVSVVGDGAYAISLGALFAVSLILLRFAADKILPKNVIVSDAANNVGGAVCGVGSAVLTVGIMVIALGHLRFGPKLMGHQAVVYSEDAASRGSLVENKGTFRPYVDEATAWFYSQLSLGVMRPLNEEPLAKWHPSLHLEPALLRTTFDGKSRNVFRPGDFAVIRRYSLGDLETGAGLSDLMKRDSQNLIGSPHGYATLEGEQIMQGHLEGFTVRFESSAKEKGSGSQVIVGNSQVRLLLVRGDESKEVLPIAVFSSADGSTRQARFRFDGNEIFIPSVGGQSQVEMTFEFAVPTGWTPEAITVKGIRKELEGAIASPEEHFSSTPQRDTFLTGQGASLADLNWLSAEVLLISDGRQVPRGHITRNEAGIDLGGSIGFSIKKNNEGSLELIENTGRSGGYYIADGVETLPYDLTNSLQRGLDSKLRISQFAPANNVAIVQIDMSPGERMSVLDPKVRNAAQDRPIVLYDSNGLPYEAIGYVYSDSEYYRIRYTPNASLRGLNDIANASALPTASKQAASLRLVFRCTSGAQIVGLGIGDRMLWDWRETPLTVQSDQR